MRSRVVTRNVAKGAKPPKLDDRDLTILDAAQTRRLLEVTASDRLGPLSTTAAMTGMRAAELLGLAWSDVDLDGGLSSYVTSSSGGRAVRSNGAEVTQRRRTIPLGG